MMIIKNMQSGEVIHAEQFEDIPPRYLRAVALADAADIDDKSTVSIPNVVTKRNEVFCVSYEVYTDGVDPDITASPVSDARSEALSFIDRLKGTGGGNGQPPTPTPAPPGRPDAGH